MAKRIVSLVLAAVMLLTGLSAAVMALAQGSLPTGFLALADWSDQAVKEHLRRYPSLEQIAPTLLLSVGAKEQDGIFITENYLLENISPSNPLIEMENTAGIDQFLTKHNLPAIMMLIPTACAIKQQELPANAVLFNQKSMIADTYSDLAGLVSTVDAYTALFSAKDQYTYYRTESNLTGLGGYYLYTALAARLGLSARPLSEFDIEHLAQDYYGDLYQRSNYKGIRPDLITLYRFSRYNRQYLLTCTDNGETRQYSTLFPTHLAVLEAPISVLFGGIGQRLDLSVVSPFEESMLIFGDETATAYLPFLAAHYGRITLVDLSRATPDQLAAIELDEYNRVMFAFSVDYYINTPLTQALSFIP